MTQNLSKISDQILSSAVSPNYAQKLHIICVKEVESRTKQFEKLRGFPVKFQVDYSMFQDKTKSISDSLTQTWEGLSQHLHTLKAEIEDFHSLLNFSNDVDELEGFLSIQEKLLEYPITENEYIGKVITVYPDYPSFLANVDGRNPYDANDDILEKT